MTDDEINLAELLREWLRADESLRLAAKQPGGAYIYEECRREYRAVCERLETAARHTRMYQR